MQIEEFIKLYPRSYSASQRGRGIQLKIMITPTEGPAGTMIDLRGSGAMPNSRLHVLWGDVYAQLDLGHRADEQGDFAFEFQAPRIQAERPHAVMVSDDSGAFDEKVFIITRGIDPNLKKGSGPADKGGQAMRQPRWWEFWKR